MPTFSAKSLERLATCHPDLQRVAHEAIKTLDFTVLCGHRTQAEQEHCCILGTSKLHWPDSKHNALPSLAMDLAPWPLHWEDEASFERLATTIKIEAEALGIKIRWGGDWQKFPDRPHYELVVAS